MLSGFELADSYDMNAMHVITQVFQRTATNFAPGTMARPSSLIIAMSSDDVHALVTLL